MRNFHEDAFRADIERMPFHVSNVFDDIDDIYWAHSQMYQSVLNEHAPLKTKWVRNEQVPYMNSELHKTIHQRNMWRNKYFRNKSDKHARKNYVKLRNKVAKLKKISIQTYFDRKCNAHSVETFTRPSGHFCLIRPRVLVAPMSFCEKEMY